MRVKTALCLSILMIASLFSGCSITAEESYSIKTDETSITQVIVEYFSAIKEGNISSLKNLFMEKLSIEPENFNFDYVKDVKIININEADYSDNTIKMYRNYIVNEYGIKEENIKIFIVKFNIKVSKGYDEELGGDNLQKFALVKENEKWLICEMFR